MLTTWHCPHPAATSRATVPVLLRRLSASRAHSSKPAAAACDETDGRTDGRQTVAQTLLRILYETNNNNNNDRLTAFDPGQPG